MRPARRPRVIVPSLVVLALLGSLVSGCASDPAATFAVTDLAIEPAAAAVAPGDEVTITARVANTGEAEGTYAADLLVDGSIVAQEDVELPPGQSRSITFRIGAGAPGDHDVRLGDAAVTLHVTDRPTARFVVGELDVEPSTGEIKPGDDIVVVATVRNTGGAAGTFDGELAVDGVVMARETLDLEAGESADLRFMVAAGEAGDHVLRLGESRSTVHVLGVAEFELTSIAVQPNPAETGDRLEVQGGLANVGGLTGTHVVRLTIDGKAVGTSEATLAGGDETIVPFTVKSPGAGRHTIAAGDLKTTLVVWRIERPANGKVLVNRVSGGLGRLKVENDGDRDAYLVLAKTSAPRKALLGVYVRAGRSATVRGIRDGTYVVYFSQGSRWDAHSRRFTVDPERRRFEDPIRFKTSRTSYTVWTLSLESVVGGNAPTDPVDEGEFPG